MPACFSISIQFQRKDLYPCFVQDFYSALFDAGMQFRSGYWEREKMERLIELAKDIWRFPYVRAIQTGLELDEATELGALEKGAEPSVRPFAILDKIRYPLDEKECLVERVAGREGMAIRDGRYFACYF